MTTTVTNEAVAEYVARIRSGSPLGKVFPAKMSECDFTDAQRRVIREARLERKAALKVGKANGQPVRLSGNGEVKTPELRAGGAPDTKSKGFTKLRRLLYLQSGRCFFCGGSLSEAEASIEHLNPLSRGGQRADENEVVCHSSLNEVFGALELKRKFELILKAQGTFVCPKR